MMAKQHLSRDERLIQKGRLIGTRENMDVVAMVLLDKMGFHVAEETEDEHDRKSIAYLYACIVDTVDEINSGKIKRRHIKDMLGEEYNVIFSD